MRLSVMVFGLVCVCALVIGTAAPLVQDDEDVRGAFLTSRPKDKPASSGTTAKPSRRKPKPSGGGSTSGGSSTTGSNNPGRVIPASPSTKLRINPDRLRRPSRLSMLVASVLE